METTDALPPVHRCFRLRAPASVTPAFLPLLLLLRCFLLLTGKARVIELHRRHRHNGCCHAATLKQGCEKTSRATCEVRLESFIADSRRVFLLLLVSLFASPLAPLTAVAARTAVLVPLLLACLSLSRSLLCLICIPASLLSLSPLF